MRRHIAGRLVTLATVSLAVLLIGGSSAAFAIGGPPLPGGDSYLAPQNGVLVVGDPPAGLLANDFDFSGVPALALGGAVNAMPVNMGPMIFPTAAGGTVTWGNPAAGGFSYSPPAGYTGADSFTYWCWDQRMGPPVLGMGVTASTVSITVFPSNAAPVASDGTADAWRDHDCDGAATATDADGDTLSFSVSTAAVHGDVVMAADGSYTYTPDPGYTGADSFEFLVDDGNGGTDTGAIAVTVSGPDYYEQNAAGIAYATPWSGLVNSRLSGGNAWYAQTSRTQVTIPFEGVACDLVFAKTTTSGKANIYLDGVLYQTVDLYACPNQFQRAVHVDAAGDGRHTVIILPLGSRNRPSAGCNVIFDAFRCWGTLGW